MAVRVPERIGWAVETLAVRPADAVLEVGCGRGLAVSLIAPQLRGGRILAIDRSATAVAAARRGWETAGQASFRHAALADLGGTEGSFDKIFAINVNLFWTDPRNELPVVRKLLKTTGRLFLFYEPPAAAQREKITRLVKEKLAGSGLTVVSSVQKDDGAPLLCLTCRLS
ncbi:MAG: class I SAM-dependent methyltransferase [Pseudomonadota bacterium]